MLNGKPHLIEMLMIHNNYLFFSCQLPKTFSAHSSGNDLFSTKSTKRENL